MNNICPACHSDKINTNIRIPDHEYKLNFRATYSTCASCGTIYQTPMPGLEELTSFYPEEYHSFTKKNALAKIHSRLRLNKLKPFIRQNQAVLDYGCGSGAFLLDAADMLPDIRFYGYEIAKEKNIKTLKDGRVTLLTGPWDELRDQIPRCDLISMNHVIEHLPDPGLIIADLYKILNDSGTLQGQTPASDSLEHAVFKKYWSGFHAPRHTVVFSKKGLKSLFEKHHFSSIEIKTGFNPAGLAVSLASLTHGDQPGRINRNHFSWFLFIGLAALLYPIDIFSCKPGMIDFFAFKSNGQ